MGRIVKFFRRLRQFFCRGGKKTKHESSNGLKDHQNNSTPSIKSQTEEVKEIKEFLITETANASQGPSHKATCQTFEQDAGDNINRGSTVSNLRGKSQEAKLVAEIAETLENIIKQVELVTQNESNILNPVDDDKNNNETTHILVEDRDIDPEIIGVMEDLIKGVELNAQPTIQNELNILQNIDYLINQDQLTEIQDPSKMSSTVKPPKNIMENKNGRTTSAQTPPESTEKYPEALTPLQENYVYKGQLGKGAYGQVHRLRHKLTKEEVAAKIVKSRHVTSSESEIWPNLAHPNLLKLLEQHPFGEYHIFVSPKQDKRLVDIIYKAPFTDIKQYLLDALCGLEYLHHMDLCHLDIKADNILIGKQGAMLCDFGFVSPSKGLRNASFKPPVIYRPPEASLSKGATAKIPKGMAVDLWAFGVMMVELFTRFPLINKKVRGEKSKVKGENWKKSSYYIIGEAITKENFKYFFKKDFPQADKNTRRAALDLIHAFLHFPPHNRISAKKAKKHPFFKNPVPKYFMAHQKDFSLWD
ncbi:hypothetical protein JTE90_008540 [Oedothorax gibbosus]|uniref:Protein kinase domain-containing protein n=1 Tax=Oedothorax gibbosus TaxID=931172 RepID=A0AAV6VIE2_9ARAC|nr:hypothetical protein JTE90_008540 [Oedothorax gibbosus]